MTRTKIPTTTPQTIYSLLGEESRRVNSGILLQAPDANTNDINFEHGGSSDMGGFVSPGKNVAIPAFSTKNVWIKGDGSDAIVITVV